MRLKLIKLFKWTGICFGILLLLLIAFVIYLSRNFDDKVKEYANEHLKGELNYRKSRLSIFDHFPYLTFTLFDFQLKGAAPFQQDTLIRSSEIGFGVDVYSLFKGNFVVNKVFISQAKVNVIVDKEGRANYDIYSPGDTTSTADSGEESFNLKIEQVTIDHTDLNYDDRSMPLIVQAKGIHYVGSGDLSESLFDLVSNADIESFDFNYDSQYYFLSKKIHADLVTRVNTRSLSFQFTRNDLRINKLPIRFTGLFEFLKNGYRMDFQINASSTDLRDIVTAMPQDYLEWMETTELRGDANVNVRLAGDYDPESNEWPDLTFKMDVKNGFVAHQHAPSAVKDLWIDLKASVPDLNPEKATVDLDSMAFQLDQGYFRASLHSVGIEDPKIRAGIHTELDLEKLQRTIGLNSFTIKGNYSLHMDADGVFSQKQNPASRKPDTIITSIPSFTLTSSLKSGFFQTSSLPGSISDVSFGLKAGCPTNNYRNTFIKADRLNVRYLDNYLKGDLAVKGGKVPFITAKLRSFIHLAALKEIFPFKEADLKGDLSLDLSANGKLDIARDKYPSTVLSAKVSNGRIKTIHYPRPIEHIQLNAYINTNSGDWRSTKIRIEPLSFLFEGQSFRLYASLQNFQDLLYDIRAKGQVDLGHLSHVFSPEDLDVSGKIKSDLVLKGRQSDVEQQCFDRLHHEGTLEFWDIETRSAYFALPVFLHHGICRFLNDSIQMESFQIAYGKSDLLMSGAVANVIQYYLHGGELRGRFQLFSNYLNVNELMLHSETGSASQSNSTEGVVVIPPELSVRLIANAKLVDMNDLHIKSCVADLSMERGTLEVRHAGFCLIDAPVTMKASYKNIHSDKAIFDYEIDAREFDIKRAYQEVELFREMVSAASSAQGVVSLQYRLKGRLNGGMEPVLPSLEGGGTLSLLKIKMKGFKLFSAISKASGKDSLNDQNINNVQIKTSIKNNLITLEPLKMRIAGLWPRVKGQTSLDGKLNLKLRLGLPPMGIVGIPFNITGTQEKPIVKLGRGKKNEALSETSDEDWE